MITEEIVKTLPRIISKTKKELQKFDDLYNKPIAPDYDTADALEDGIVQGYNLCLQNVFDVLIGKEGIERLSSGLLRAIEQYEAKK